MLFTGTKDVCLLTTQFGKQRLHSLWEREKSQSLNKDNEMKAALVFQFCIRQACHLDIFMKTQDKKKIKTQEQKKPKLGKFLQKLKIPTNF